MALRFSRRNATEDATWSASEKSLLQRWITAGTPGLKAESSSKNSEHWSFREFVRNPIPAIAGITNDATEFRAGHRLTHSPPAEPVA